MLAPSSDTVTIARKRIAYYRVPKVVYVSVLPQLRPDLVAGRAQYSSQNGRASFFSIRFWCNAYIGVGRVCVRIIPIPEESF